MEKKSVFTHIYENRIWGEGSLSNPLSGSGSNPDNAKPYVDFVKEITLSYELTSVLDVGHGDWAMWRDYKFDGIKYIGVDVATGISRRMTEKYGNKSKIFIQIEKEAKLPDAELLICKDVLQHLSLKDMEPFLSQITKFPYLILCNAIYLKMPISREIRYIFQLRTRIKALLSRKSPFFAVSLRRNNSGISTGGFRGLDLEDRFFSEKFNEFELVKKFDYDGDGPIVEGIRKRVYFYKRKDNFTPKA